MRLHPEPSISAASLAAGQRALVADAGWATLTGSLSGGVVLVAFALEMGAGPRAIGLLGAIPFVAQAAQLPAIFLVERFRSRKLIGVPLLTVARLVNLALALLPILPLDRSRPGWLIAAQATISVLGSVAACAINSWFHQLLPPADLGAVFSKRLLSATGLACVATLGVGLIVDHLVQLGLAERHEGSVGPAVRPLGVPLRDLGDARPVRHACGVAHPGERRSQRAPGHPGDRVGGAADGEPVVDDRRCAWRFLPVRPSLRPPPRDARETSALTVGGRLIRGRRFASWTDL